MCCWMCFVHRDRVATLTLHSVTKKRTGCTQGLYWVSISLPYSGNSINRCYICLFVGTICTTSFTWLGLLQSVLKGSEQCHTTQNNCRPAPRVRLQGTERGRKAMGGAQGAGGRLAVTTALMSKVTGMLETQKVRKCPLSQ